MSEDRFPPEILSDLQRFAARMKPPITARELALELVSEGLAHLCHQEQLEVEHGRADKLDLGSLTNEQFDHLQKLLLEARGNQKSARKTTTPSKKK